MHSHLRSTAVDKSVTDLVDVNTHFCKGVVGSSHASNILVVSLVVRHVLDIFAASAFGFGASVMMRASRFLGTPSQQCQCVPVKVEYYSMYVCAS